MDPNFRNEPLESFSNGPRPVVICEYGEAFEHLNQRHKALAREFQKAMDEEAMTQRMSMTIFDSLVQIHDRNCRYNVVIKPAFD